MRRNLLPLTAFGFAFAISSAMAQGQLNIVCSVQLPWCEAVVNQFQKDTGIKIGMTQKSAGEAMAQVGIATAALGGIVEAVLWDVGEVAAGAGGVDGVGVGVSGE